MEKLVVNSNDSGTRIDAYIAGNVKELSRTMVKKLADEGNIKVNGNVPKVSYKVQENDVIEIIIPEAKELDMIL